jgi:hypothetical protein
MSIRVRALRRRAPHSPPLHPAPGPPSVIRYSEG